MPLKTPPALTTAGLVAVLLAGCSGPEPVTTGGRAVAAPATAPEDTAPTAPADPASQPTAEEQPEPAQEPTQEPTEEPELKQRPTLVAQTLNGTSSDGRKVSVRVDAAAPQDLQSYLDDVGAGQNYVYVMATCEDWCSLADLGPMTLVTSGRTVDAQPVAGLGEQEGTVFDLAPVPGGSAAVLPATGAEIDTDRADALWRRAEGLAEKYGLGAGDPRRVYLMKVGDIVGKVDQAKARIGRQTMTMNPVH